MILISDPQFKAILSLLFTVFVLVIVVFVLEKINKTHDYDERLQKINKERK